MLARQRELRPGVIKLRSDVRGLPGIAGVAGLASGRECGPMRILVAGVAGRELQAREPDDGFRVRRLGVALLARHFQVRRGELVLRLIVVEVRGWFPL